MNCMVNFMEPPRFDVSGKILKAGLGEMGNATISDKLVRIKKELIYLVLLIQETFTKEVYFFRYNGLKRPEQRKILLFVII